MIRSVIQSKKPTIRRFPATSIIENSRTMVAKSIEPSASRALTTRKATISTAPMIAAPGRSMRSPGNLPIAKTR